MKTTWLIRVGLGALGSLALTAGAAEAGGRWTVGVGVGVPYYPRPYYWGPGFYRPVLVAPTPIYVAPPPTVIVQPAPLVQSAPIVQPQATQPVYEVPRLQPVNPTTTATPVSRAADLDGRLQLLADRNESVRLDAVTQLGRLRDPRAIDPLAASLTGDASATVRAAAAQALGLIGSKQALPALRHAAQTDTDASVRRTAQFVVDLLESR